MKGGEIINCFEIFVKVKSVFDYIVEFIGIIYEDILNVLSAYEVL